MTGTFHGYGRFRVIEDFTLGDFRYNKEDEGFWIIPHHTPVIRVVHMDKQPTPGRNIFSLTFDRYCDVLTEPTRKL